MRWGGAAQRALCAVALVAASLSDNPGARAQEPAARARPKVVGYRADHCRYQAKARHVDCQGNVVVTREDLRIACRTLNADVDDKGQIVSLTCRGDVEIVTQERVARSERARYNGETDTLLLEGQARVAQGASRLAGRAITIDLDSGDVVVEGSVRGVLGPEIVGKQP